MNMKFRCVRCEKEYLPHELRYSKMFKNYYCPDKECGNNVFQIIKKR